MMETVKAGNVFEAAMYAENGYIPAAGRTYLDTLEDMPGCPGFVDIEGLQGINTVEQYENCICIGAAVTMSYMAEYLMYDFTGEFNDLCRAALSESEDRIKRATLGGCIAVCPENSGIISALLLHDAKVELMGRNGIRMLDLSRFLENGKPELNGDIITGVILYRTKKMDIKNL